MHISPIRTANGATVAEVAKHSSLSPMTVSAVEKGNGSIRSTLKVLDALGAEISWKGKRDRPVGMALALRRKEAAISQRRIAQLIGVTQPTIIALEVRNSGRMATMIKYLEVLGIKASIKLKKRKPKPKLVPAKNNSEADKVFTPRALGLSIIQNLPLSGTVLDPCRGDGAFFDQLPNSVERRWCEVDQGQDFLDWDEHVDWVVSNPPWSKMREFLNHGMNFADNVCYLAAFTHFTTKARVRDIKNHGFAMRSILFVPTPKEWPQSGFQMAAVWLQRSWDGPCEMKHLK